MVRRPPLRLVGLGLEQERAVDDDVLARLQAGEDLDLAAEVAAAADGARLERAGRRAG